MFSLQKTKKKFFNSIGNDLDISFHFVNFDCLYVKNIFHSNGNY